ncbi:MAG: peptidylprolyl isomerase [Candidatus Omnitrophica bacterium]|nr:peptidylprolyl isomerase [Candidatus Omnitrophota bacterium]
MRSVQLLSIILLAVCAVQALSPAVGSAEEMKIVAVVNDEVITQADLDRAFLPVYLQFQATSKPDELAERLPELKRQVLAQLVEERLMLQEAKKPRPVEVSKGKIGTPPAIEVSEAEVAEMAAQASGRFPSPQEFNEALTEQGLTLEDLKVRFREQITIQKLVDREIRSHITISPAEVTAYYNAHANEFQTAAAVQAAVILIKPKSPLEEAQAQQLAQEIHRQLAGGADFYELAKRYSDGPNAKMGGRIGFLEKGKVLKEIGDTLFDLKAGEVSPVIKTAAGYHLFRVESVRPAHQASLEEVQGRIQDRLFREKVSGRYREWIDKLKASAYLSVP